MTDNTHLIIGGGYLGMRLQALFAAQTCWITRRTPQATAIMLDCNKESSWNNLMGVIDTEHLLIYFLVPPSQIELNVFPHFLQRLKQLKYKRIILVSSTVVYGNLERDVNADSNVQIDSPRAERQYQIERLCLENMNNASVVRLAGIYGPGRIIGKSSILQGKKINGDPEGWLNLIHVDDAAALLKRMGEMETPAQLELGCDGHPVRRKDYYTFVARQIGGSPPEFNHDKSRGIGRRCDNETTVRRTTWQPEFKDYQAGVMHSI